MIAWNPWVDSRRPRDREAERGEREGEHVEKRGGGEKARGRRP